MALSSVSVVANSLRLRRFRPGALVILGLVAVTLFATARPAAAGDGPSLRGTVTMPSVVAGAIRHVRVDLRGPDGRPATGPGVGAEVFQGFGARAATTLAADGPGVYTGRPAPRA